MLCENDVLVPDGLYVVNAYHTSKVFTQVGSDIYLRKYEEGNKKQVVDQSHYVEKPD